MLAEDNYLEKNKAAWNSRTDHHIHSAFYDMESFLNGRSSLKNIELELLGDIKDKTVLHLQCHFGQDTISLEKLGATVTGVDLSDNAIDKARALAKQMNAAARFICCDLYALPSYLDEKFDLLFSTYGTIGWLPDLDKWASVVAGFLKPGGTFVFAEFHPVLWMFDNDFTKVTYTYAKSDPIVDIEQGTYADKLAPITTEMITWNHGLGEVVTSLLKYGLDLNIFREYDYSPYNCFNDMIEVEPGKFRLRTFGNKVPMVYALKAVKR